MKQKWSGKLPGKKLEGTLYGVPIYSVQPGEMDQEEYQRLLESMKDKVFIVDESKMFLRTPDYLKNSIGLKIKRKPGKMTANKSHSSLDESQTEEDIMGEKEKDNRIASVRYAMRALNSSGVKSGKGRV